MVIAKYKAFKQFEYNGFKYGIGMVIISEPEKVKDLVETGKIRLDTYLDPTDVRDIEEIDRFTDNPEGTVTGQVADVRQYRVVHTDGMTSVDGKEYATDEFVHLDSELASTKYLVDSKVVVEDSSVEVSK